MTDKKSLKEQLGEIEPLEEESQQQTLKEQLEEIEPLQPKDTYLPSEKYNAGVPATSAEEKSTEKPESSEEKISTLADLEVVLKKHYSRMQKTAEEKPEPQKQEKSGSKIKNLIVLSAAAAIILTGKVFLPHFMGYLRDRRISGYTQTIRDIDRKIKNNQFLAADKLSENLQEKLKQETHPDFKLLRKKVKEIDDYTIDPGVITTKLNEIQELVKKGKFSEARDQSTALTKKFKEENQVQPNLEQVTNYMSRTIDPYLLIETDYQFEANKQKYISLVQKRADNHNFIKILSNMQRILQIYLSLNENEKAQQVQDLITKTNQSISAHKRNEQKLTKYYQDFEKIKHLIKNKDYRDADSQIRSLADIIERENLSSSIDILNKIKGFTYRKSVSVPKRTEKRIVLGGFYEQIYEPPVSKTRRSFRPGNFIGDIGNLFKRKKPKGMFPAETVQVSEGGYRKGRLILPYYENLEVPAYQKTIQVNPYSGKEKVIAITKPKQSNLDNAIEANFDVGSNKRVDIKRRLPYSIGNHLLRLHISEVNGSLNIGMSPEYKYSSAEIEIFISKYKTGNYKGRDIGAKLISSYHKHYLHAILHGRDSIRNTVENGIVHQDVRTDGGILRLRLQIDSWGPAKTEPGEVSYGGISHYNYTKIGGKIRISYIPLELR